MLLNCFLAIFLFVTVSHFPFSARAKVFQAGQQNPSGPSLPGSVSPDAANADPKAALNGLWSEKSFARRDALKDLTEKAHVWAEAGALEQKHVDRAVELLGDESDGVRDAAANFIEKRGGLLLEKKWLTAESISEVAKQGFLSEEALRRFVLLVHAVLKHPQAAGLITAEHSFQILDALDAQDTDTAQAARDTLVHDGAKLAGQGAWSDVHTKAFLREFGQASREAKPGYLDVLTANLPTWVAERHFAPAELRDAIAPGKMPSEDEQRLIDFLADPQTVKVLKEINFYDRAWAEKLLTAFRQGSESEKNWAQVWIARLMRAFAQSGTLSSADFKSVWQGVSEGLAASADPFEVVNPNIDPLLKSGWLSQAEYDKLLVGLDKRTEIERKRILSFLNDHYERFSEKGWVSATPLVPAVFAPTDDLETRRLQLALLHDHPDLVTEKQIFSAEELPGFLKLLEHKDGDIFEYAVGILKTGFDTWAKQGLITPQILTQLLNLEPGRSRTAKILNAVLSHFDHNAELFTRAHVLRVSEYGQSPHEEVIAETENFFSKNYKLLEEKNLTSPKLKKNLVQAEIWDEIPKTQKKKLKRHKTKPN